MHLHEAGEFGLIARLAQRLAQRPGVRLGIGDDAAVLEALAAPIVTCDGLVEQVHFRRDWTTPRQLGRKAIAVNVSDIAAMGGRPVAAFITLALAAGDDVEFVEELYSGFEEAASFYGLTIAGGDTVRSLSGLMLNVALIGDAPHAVTRGGAGAGDVLLVTGTLGDAAAGLALLQAPAVVAPSVREPLLQRHHDPTARLAEMHAALSITAAPAAVKAALDISDGLAGDAGHLAHRSQVSLEIDVELLPIGRACREAALVLGVDVLDWVLRGGEDYELLLSVAPDVAGAVADAVVRATGTPVTAIGRCLPPSGAPVVLVHADGRRERAGGAFSHF